MFTTQPINVQDSKLSGIGTPACETWRNRILSRHSRVSHILINQYKATSERLDYAEANRELSRSNQELKLERTGLTTYVSDEELRSYCKAKTRSLERDFVSMAKRTNIDQAIKWLNRELSYAGLEIPIKESETNNKEARISAVARALCPKWWRRQLSAMAARRLEQFMRARGLVCRQRSAYVSAYGMAGRSAQKSRNRKLLQTLEAISEAGDVISLVDAADAGMSNPVNRRNELMVRLRGYEEIAAALGLNGEFLTLTCPGKYHAVLSRGGRMNPKYNGSTPRDAQDYLNDVWAKIRASWLRAGIRAFGFRVAEPHHDGTPHWHLLLFFRPDESDAAWEIFQRYGLQEDGQESRAQEVRVSRETIDTSKGTATGYLAKYISKNIDGFEMNEDLEAETSANEGAMRVDAWASVWGIRQFQQIGSTSVTVWREFRRIREVLEDSHPEILEKIRQAADSGDWAKFVELMGGALVTRDGQTVRAWMVERESENQYAEITKRLKGLILLGVSSLASRLITRNKNWTIQPIKILSDTSATGPP